MSEQDNQPPGGLGLTFLVTLLHWQCIGADPEQLRHRFGAKSIGLPEMLRCAKDFGLKVRVIKTNWARFGWPLAR